MAWYPDATRLQGPLDKQGYPGLSVNECRGVVLHSMVGSFPDAWARMTGPDRASWHFNVLQDGRVIQTYDTLAVAWHAGSEVWNGRVIGIEHEGGAKPNVGEPLTPAQLKASLALVRWLRDTCMPDAHFQRYNPATNPPGTFLLLEHNQIYATACPSGRIPWPYYLALNKEEDMKPFLVWDADLRRVYFVSPLSVAWITQAADVAALEALYGKLSVALRHSTLEAIAGKPLP